jgi:F1F0 ATPase subunit 2
MPFVLSLIAGAALGLFYFGGLWLTIRRLPESRRPAALALASFVGRTALTVAGFYLLMDGQWPRLALGLAGFLGARTVLVSRAKRELARPREVNTP